MPDSTLLLVADSTGSRYNLATEEIIYTQEFPGNIQSEYLKQISYPDTTYALKTSQGYIIYQNLDSINFVTAPGFGVPLIPDGFGNFSLLFSDYETGENRLEKYDAFGNLTEEVFFSTNLESYTRTAVSTQDAVFFGGSDRPTEACNDEQTAAVYGVDFFNDTVPEIYPDIGIDEVVFPQAVGITEIFDLNNHRLYHYQETEVTVANFGEVPVDSFYVFTNARENTSYNIYECDGLLHYQVHIVTETPLLPGETTTVILPDFFIRVSVNEPLANPLVKIWTTFPNGDWDENLQNNSYCTEEYLTTNTDDLTVDENLKLDISPNPTANRLIVKGSERFTDYAIYDTSGTLLSQGKMPRDGMLFVGNLPRGVYFLEVSGDVRKRTARFIR